VAGAALALTGLAKVASALGASRVLEAPDPLLGVSFRKLLLLAGGAELLIASLCFSKTKRRLGMLLLAWFATELVVYRLGLWLTGWHQGCRCLGTLTDMLHVPPGLVDNIMRVILACLLLGSYAALLAEWRERRALRARAPAPGVASTG
jgi:hypothetical protein